MKPVALCLAAVFLFAGVSVRAAETAGVPALIGLTRAVGVAERFMTAHMLAAWMDTKAGRVVYRIDLSQGEDLYRLTVDGLTGDVVQASTPWLSGLWHDMFLSGKMRVAETLAPAAGLLSTFEEKTGGSVQHVALDLEGGHPFYEVRISTAAGTTEVTFDARTGERIPADR